LVQEFVPFVVTVVPVLLEMNVYGAVMGLKESYVPVVHDPMKPGKFGPLTTNPIRV
jgi:hypothetical protein